MLLMLQELLEICFKTVLIIFLGYHGSAARQVLTAKLNDVTSIPWTPQGGEREPMAASCLLTTTHAHVHVHTHITHNN